MVNDISSKVSSDTPQVANSTENNSNNLNGISPALKRRAEAVINNRLIDAETRTIIRYGLEINDPSLPELVRRVEAGEIICDATGFTEAGAIVEDASIDEKIECLAGLICRAGDEPATKAAALLVLMDTLETAPCPKALANTTKDLAFAHWRRVARLRAH